MTFSLSRKGSSLCRARGCANANPSLMLPSRKALLRPLARSALTLTAALAISSGCIDTDPAVFVDPDLENPVLTVSDKALGVELSGSFEITLHLGARASGDSTVAFDAFSLETEDGTVVVESLPVSTNTNLPVKVPAGGDDVVVAFDISTGDTLLESDMKDALCGQALVLSVILDDSLATQATPVASDPFEAICP